MPRKKPLDPKAELLREQGVLNARPDRVQDLLFAGTEFFDRRDLVQVKYEMLRRAQIEGRPVTECAKVFGLSRPSFYLAQASLAQRGLAGLIPRKRGPHGGHKLTREVLDFVEEARREEPRPSLAALAERVETRYGVKAHPRSLERALRRREKKRR